MSVPNTTTFSLQDVQTELGGVNDDLIECFSNAAPLGFDPTYEGSKNQLLNFRNYTHIIYTLFYSSSSGAASGTLACPGDTSVKRWHDGAGTYPVVNDLVYIESTGTTLFNGNNDWFPTLGTESIQINTVGKVIATHTC